MDAHRDSASSDPVTGARRRGLQLGLALLGVLLVVLVLVGITTGAIGAWVAAALVAALGLGAAALAVASGRPTAPPARIPVTDPTGVSAPAAVRDVDDLPAFFAAPPGSAAPPAGAMPAGATPAPGSPGQQAPPSGPVGPMRTPPPVTPERRRGLAAALAAAAVVLVVAAGTIAVLGHEDRDDPPGRDRRGADDRPVGHRGDAGEATAQAPLTASAAGDLAAARLAPGEDGLAARLAFAGLVLEPRAVGATVTYPQLDVSSDGRTGVAHLVLPTWNCLTGSAPADPVAAGCTATLTEYADLATPDLQLTAQGADFQLTGTFATYTRSNGAPPAYTGRSYEIGVQAGPEGRLRDGRAPATGDLQLGGGTAATTGDPTANVVRVSG